MVRRIFALPAIGLILSLLGTTHAVAAGQRTFVASWGNDANPCTLASPCRSFAPAVAAANAGGEVVVLDSAGYGPFTITKSISIIVPPGVYGGMSPFAGQDGVTIAAGSSDKVVVRGLTINGQGGNRGIVVNSAGDVHIEQCTVINMGQNGIEVNGGVHVHIRSSGLQGNAGHGLAVLGGTPTVDVSDSQLARNGYSGIYVNSGNLHAKGIVANDNQSGVFLGSPGAGVGVYVTLTDSAVSRNTYYGTSMSTNAAGSTAHMTIVRSTAAHNGLDGFGAYYQGAGTTFLSVSDSASVANGSGLTAIGAGTTAIVTRSTLADNYNYDVYQDQSAVLRTSGNNTLTATGFKVFGTFSSNTLF